MVKAIHSWKPISKRPTGTPKTRWEDNIKTDIPEVGWGGAMDWTG
jgi:hypothetical protein